MNAERASILIIGAGIAGASCAWHLREMLGSAAKIRIVEAAERVGGRIQRLEVGGEKVEAGATLIHSSNRCVNSFRQQLGLQWLEPHGPGEGRADVVIWNGADSAFASGNALTTSLLMLKRYGLAPLRAGRQVRQTVAEWEKVYPLLESGAGFPATRDLFHALRLQDVCMQSAYAYYAGVGLADRFVKEFIDGVSRINYGQCGDMNAFASMVSLAGAGLAGGKLYSLEGGNDQLVSGLLAQAGSEVSLNFRVAGLSREARGWSVHDAHDKRFAADIVIVACDPQFELPNEYAALSEQHEARRWQATHATFVCGNLRADALTGLDLSTPPGTVLTIEDARLPLTSLGLVGHSRRFDAPIWKIFSRQELRPAVLSGMFVHMHDQQRIAWSAYPVLPPVEHWPAFQVAATLFDASALETVVSTMETQAISGWNVANLVARAVKG